MTNKEKYINDLDILVKKGAKLQFGLYHELKDHYQEAIDKLDAKQKKIIQESTFKDKYNAWYNEALSLVRQLMPERLEDFVSFYKQPKRKEITSLTYTISDYLLGVEIKNSWKEVIVDGTAVVSKFQQQFLIIEALKNRFISSLYDIKQLVQSDMMDSELDSAKLLLHNGFLRSAGAICGVVLEKHFSTICESRNLKIGKKNPSINDYNQKLKDEAIIDVPTWRHICLLGDIRNLCDHDKKQEPTAEQVNDLIVGTDKIIKTVF